MSDYPLFRFWKRSKLGFKLLLLVFFILRGLPGVKGQESPFDQVHLAVPNIDQAMEWYQSILGGLTAQGEPKNRLFFGDTRVGFLTKQTSIESYASSIDHIGFEVSNLASTLNQVVESGGMMDGPSSHADDGIMIRDPWGTKLELRPGETSILDHIEIRTSDPLAEIKWLQQFFDGELTNLYEMPGLSFNEVHLIFSEGLAGRSEGTAFDHIGWRTDDIEQAVSVLRDNNVRFLSGIEPRGPIIRVVFIEGPSGVKVEILQRTRE